MSYLCNWCGKEIVGKRGLARLEVRGMFEDTTGLDGWIDDVSRHFHSGQEDDDDSCLLRAIRLIDSRKPTPTPLKRVEMEEEAWRARKEAWESIPAAERRHWVLNALGDRELSTSEIATRIEKAHDCTVYAADTPLRKCLCAMVDGGDLTRERRPRGKGKIAWKWAYLRAAEPSAPIVALERALNATEPGTVT